MLKPKLISLLMHNDYKVSVTQNRFYSLVIIFSFVVLSISFSAEHLFKIIPCYLCKLERIPFIGMFFFSAVGVFYNRNQIPLFFLAGICLISLGLGAYHFGVQQHFFTDQCKVTSIASLDDFKKILNIPSCSKVELALFGIPAPLANSICSLALFIKTIATIKKSKTDNNLSSRTF